MSIFKPMNNVFISPCIRGNPKIETLEELLDDEMAWCFVVSLIMWCGEQRSHGLFMDLPARRIAKYAGWKGDPDTFVEALQESGLVDDLGFVGWLEHQGAYWKHVKNADLMARYENEREAVRSKIAEKKAKTSKAKPKKAAPSKKEEIRAAPGPLPGHDCQPVAPPSLLPSYPPTNSPTATRSAITPEEIFSGKWEPIDGKHPKGIGRMQGALWEIFAAETGSRDPPQSAHMAMLTKLYKSAGPRRAMAALVGIATSDWHLDNGAVTIKGALGNWERMSTDGLAVLQRRQKKQKPIVKDKRKNV